MPLVCGNAAGIFRHAPAASNVRSALIFSDGDRSAFNDLLEIDMEIGENAVLIAPRPSGEFDLDGKSPWHCRAASLFKQHRRTWMAFLRKLAIESNQREEFTGAMKTGTEQRVTRLQFAAPLRAVDDLLIERNADNLKLQVVKTVDADDPYLSAHFRDAIIYPGVFIIETVRQAVAAAVNPPDGRILDVHSVHSVRFLSPLYAGNDLLMEATIRAGKDGSEYEAVADCLRRQDGEPIAHVSLSFYFGDAA